MDEMRQLISRRQAEGPATPHRPRSFIGENNTSKTPEMINPAALTRLEESLADADQSMVRAISHHETMRSDLEQIMLEIKEVSFNGLFGCRGLIFSSRKPWILIEREWNYRTPSANVSLLRACWQTQRPKRKSCTRSVHGGCYDKRMGLSDHPGV